MTRSRLPAVLIAIAVAGCGPASHAAEGNSSEGAGSGARDPAQPRLTLASEAFQEGQAIPAQYSCEGGNRSPSLRWSAPPARTKSFALVIDDPDAPSGTFRHWGAYDIPASARGIGAGEHLGSEVNNDGGKPGYTGPCPPKGNGVHHYHFKLFALDVERLGLRPNAKVPDVEKAASGHAIAQGELIGTYERK
jgi:Raf kinase inhibitor-like YbhB/YbcL family protein